MNRPLPYLLTALLVAGGLFGCAGSGFLGKPSSSPSSSGARATARSAVRELVAAYDSNDAQGFLERVDASGFSSFNSFEDYLRDFLRDNREIEIDVIFDSDVEQGDRIAAAFHWNRSLVTKAGQHVLSKGSGELVFRRAPGGRLLLTAIRGASPF